MDAWSEIVRELTLKLVGWPSVTNTLGECQWSQQLAEWLGQQPYFAAHPSQLRLERTVDDGYERSNLYALVRGTGPTTVVLAGHYDMVSIENYGSLAEWATDPEALLPRLIASLEHGSSPTDQLALDDLRSGDFLPGRGALDMKSGLAVGLAVLLHFAAQPECRGNLLFIATPDEEEASHGARSAAIQLHELAKEWGLDLAAAINLDATSDQAAGEQGQAVFLGTVGKFLPLIYLVGRETHAGYPFDGINVNRMAAAVTQAIECNIDLCDEAEGELAPPPISLKQSDLKAFYDVTTPSTAWCYFNYLTHGRPANMVLEQFMAATHEALDAVLTTQFAQAQRYATLVGSAAPVRWQAQVLSYAELVLLAQQHGGPAFASNLAEFTAQLLADRTLDAPNFSRQLVAYLWRCAGMSGPAAVVCFGSLHYPHSLVAGHNERERRLRAACERHAQSLAAEHATTIKLRPFFAGISDMSFYGSAMEHDDQTIVAANTPLWGSRLKFDYNLVRTLNLPTINIGPWGRDYHQRLERVYMPYLLNTLPELIWRVACDVLEFDK
ncbi:M20/M25/M40 family metallo-hydrolase [Herpetosiphon llansteffanensis]|uniref:M20/M25/M40 family metallo-hydrolase n=1 Tax=Herpetosiphon llansteffanensis TaxID=2094568 RepID=UPI000D7CA247|nr:M20/M25/M40 family metallo-hydrolase [Herpetosiphon llansteffanensis]